jgi:hypothetical protein
MGIKQLGEPIKSTRNREDKASIAETARKSKPPKFAT